MALAGPDYAAPAKLNLFLHVLGRRPDGYHLLQSAFTLIDRADRLRFAVRGDGRIVRVNQVAGVAPEDDLAVRAARRLQQATGTRLGADVEVEKRIPLGGGLGGGSSDAATTLLVLNRLWKTGLDEADLLALGLELGADVPFFIFGRNAWVEGIGERLAPLEIPRRWYVVLTPPVQVSTEAVFAAPELTRNTEALKMEDFSARPESERFRNDLERAVCERYPEVRTHLEWLRGRGNARMTGSGSSVFAAYADWSSARRVLDELPPTMSGFIAQALEQHPLRAR